MEKKLLVSVYGEDLERFIEQFGKRGGGIVSLRDIQMLKARGNMFVELNKASADGKWWTEGESLKDLD